MAKQANVYKLMSNEWAVPYWLLGIFALLLGILSYAIQAHFPEQAGLFNNGMFVLLLLLLSIFYRKLYITKVDVQYSEGALVLTYRKLFFPQQVVVPLSDLTAMGVEKTEGVSGIVQVPEKYWILLQRQKKKLYLYEQDGSQQVKGLFHVLLQEAPHVERLQQILR
jgi:hypothetical protein